MAMKREIPLEIAETAEALRSAFGPTVKFLRVVTDDGQEIGNEKWDALMDDEP